MSKPAQKFIIDTEAVRLVTSFGTLSGVNQPTFFVGDTVPVEVYLVRQPGPGAGLVGQAFPAGSVVRMAIGQVNAGPTSGTWKIGYSTDMSAALAYNITAADLQTALNGLTSVSAAGGVTVDKVGGQYRISWVSNGARTPFTQGADTLVPAADIQQQTLQEGSVSQPEVVMVNLAVRPIALTADFTDLAAISGSHSDTGFAIDGPVSGGGYRLQLTYAQNGVTKTVWTDTIPTGSNTSAIAQFIYNTLTNVGWGYISTTNPTVNAWGLSVTQLGGYEYRVDFVAPEFTTPISATLPTIIGIDVSQVNAYLGKQAVLGLNTVEAVALLGTNESVRGVLEVEIEADGEVQTVLQTTCSVLGQVIANGTFSTVPLEVPLTETVGDARYIRRDADQTTDPTSLNQIWENITGQTTVAGEDIAGAIGAAASPSATNPLATMADVGAGYDQSLNTTDAVSFANVNVSNGSASVLIDPVAGVSLSGSFSTGIDSANLYFTTLTLTEASGLAMGTAGQKITFPSTFTLDDVNAGGTVATGGAGTNITDTDYPTEVFITVNGVQYAVPARLV